VVTKGITLARYLMIANMTITAAGACAALPQQQKGESSSRDFASTTIEVPAAKTETRPSAQHSNWLMTSGSGISNTAGRLFEDQKQIWTSPLRLRLSDA
jgi:hypothetical protein